MMNNLHNILFILLLLLFTHSNGTTIGYAHTPALQRRETQSPAEVL